MDIFGKIVGYLSNADLWQILEIAGTAVGLVYIYLEYKANVWLWLAGIVMPAIYIYVYYKSGFYADMGINIYYLLAGLYGWAYWLGRTILHGSRGGDAPAKVNVPITRTPQRQYMPLFSVTTVSFAVIAYILVRYTDSTVPYGDSLTTALSIAGLWMLARKYVEQWLVWIAVDVICCGLYLFKGLYPTGTLYGLYAVIAVFGYFKWKRMMTEQQIPAGK
ncbi:MAG: nicotinamide riboside transporter PnuC [Rikenellaceae bacterium]|nr:nicotinamide riboside transporter PnuC [Rikenellaceae bacterium]